MAQLRDKNGRFAAKKSKKARPAKGAKKVKLGVRAATAVYNNAAVKGTVKGRKKIKKLS